MNIDELLDQIDEILEGTELMLDYLASKIG